MKSYHSVILAAATLAGCAQPPLKSDITKTTRVSVTNASAPAMFTASAYEDDYDCYGRRPLASLGDEHRDFSAEVPTKRFQSVEFTYIGVNPPQVNTCSGVATVATREGFEYRFEFQRVAGGCTMAAFERQNWVETKIPFIVRNLKQPFWNNAGPWCREDSRFLGSSNLATPRTEADE
ncbi:hypothetical protein [Cupriavidus sp. WS]|uniref:hypothetical protein n=1 Tax=Cupriavidus sp. WS TaxID=1312922 RepID=UPI0012DC0244|nr:hypothetical protein [Cupriavidus sp. WS]